MTAERYPDAIERALERSAALRRAVTERGANADAADRAVALVHQSRQAVEPSHPPRWTATTTVTRTTPA